MTPEQRKKIRLAAYGRAAREVNAFLNHSAGMLAADLYPDPEERQLFEDTLHSIVERLERG